MITPISQASSRIYARAAGIAFLVYIAADMASMGVASQPHVASAFTLLGSLSALVLGVTLYKITRAQGPALALLALTCRVVESVSAQGAIFFAVGSTLFCWLLLRGRMIPTALAWFGVIASALLVVLLPLQLAGLLGGSMPWSASLTWLQWIPMLVFELTLAVWLMIKGVAIPAMQPASL